MARVLRSGSALLLFAVIALACDGDVPVERAQEPPAAAPAERLRRRPANLIVISIDTLRADRLSVYGYDRPTSPHLERFAEQAVVFDRFYHNGGATLPSHMTLMTSLRPGTHQVDPAGRGRLAAEHETFAERLSEAGYRTGAFVDGGWMRGAFGFSRGFDFYDDAGGRLGGLLPRATSWLYQHRDERFFLFLHTYDVHAEMHGLPYECPDGYHERYTEGLDVDFDGCEGDVCAARYLAILNKGIEAGDFTLADRLSEDELAYISALYDGCINYVDDVLATLFAWLRKVRLWDDTLIVVLSDHGEEFAERGRLLHHEIRGFEEIARIPLMLKLPGSQLGGRRVPHLAAMVDVMPTLLDALGLEPSPKAQGVSLLPAVTDDRPVRDAVSLGNALRTDRWKWIGPAGELYDVENDSQERVDLASADRATAENLASRLRILGEEDRRARSSDAAPPSPVELDAAKREELKALGYLE
jgi:arylsulfatase